MLNKEVLESIFEKLLSQAKKSYDEFNAADGKIGDGDLGVTILNGLEEVNNNKVNFKDDMGANFMLCSQAFVKKSGSSFGTLIAFSFMNISKNLKGKTECNHNDIIDIFETALKTPGEIEKLGEWPNEQLYKKYRGSASLDSKKSRGDDKNVEGNHKVIPYKGKVKRILHDVTDGIRSSFSYVGANDITEFHSRVEFIKVTDAGIIEAQPHLMKN